MDLEVWPRKVQFTGVERLWLVNVILPRQGNITTLRVLRELLETIAFNDEENKLTKITEDGDKKHFDVSGVSVRTFELGPKTWDIIKDSLVKLERKGQLDKDCVHLYTKIVEKDS